MKEKHVPSAWIEREGRRLDCGPYLSGAMEARMRLEGLPGSCVEPCSLTRGHEGGISRRAVNCRPRVTKHGGGTKTAVSGPKQR